MAAAALVLFFLSGAVGLIYEVLWAKYLALVLGGTALAQSAVLALFLGGLAAGYAFLGPRADRSSSPLKLYALLEAGVALIGLSTPWLMSTPLGMIGVLISAFLMGGTMPAMTRWATRSLGGMAASVSACYCANSLGASVGALAAAFVLIPRLGLDGASIAAGSVNLAVAAAALKLSGRSGRSRSGTSFRCDEPGEIPGAVSRRVVYTAAFVSGFVALAYETAWIRMLALVLGSSAYSFAVMLAAFIAGISLGSLAVASGVQGRFPAHRLLALAFFGAGASLTVTLPAYESLPYVFTKLRAIASGGPNAFAGLEAMKFAFCFMVMIPPAAFIGAALPLASRAATRSASEVGSRVGAVFGLNALGNVAGALAAGLWLMPSFGIDRIFAAGVAAQAALGTWLLWSGEPRAGRAWRIAGVCATCLALLRIGTPLWDKRPFTFGAFRFRIPGAASYPTYLKALERYTLLYYRDGREATVSVVQYPQGDRALMVNGKTDASTFKDVRTQSLLAHIPLALAAEPREVLIIGLGSGMTAGAALKHPVASVDVVELAPGVLEAEPFFREHNHRPLEDARAAVTLGDGRAFLSKTHRRFDVIISEPSNPWIAGVGNLFSADFYGRVRGRLNPGGLMAQWFHAYEMDDETLRLTIRTFASRFPEISIWSLNLNDILIIGSESAIEPDFNRMRERLARPEVRRDIERLGISRFTTFLSLRMHADAAARSLAGPGPLNTDRFPRLEYSAPRAFSADARANVVFRAEAESESSSRGGSYLERYLESANGGLENEDYREIVRYHGESRPEFLRGLLGRWRRAFPQEREASMAEARLRRDDGDLGGARRVLEEWLSRHPKDAAALEFAAEIETSDYARGGSPSASQRAAALLERSLGLPGAERSTVFARLARLDKARGDFRSAIRHFSAAALVAGSGSAEPADTLWMEAAGLALELEDSKTLLDCLERALAFNPGNRQAREMLEILMRENPQAGKF